MLERQATRQRNHGHALGHRRCKTSKDGFLPVRKWGCFFVPFALTSLIVAVDLVGCSSDAGSNHNSADAAVFQDGGVQDDASGPGADGQAADASTVDPDFTRVWVYESKTSALVFWERADISTSGTSSVEYGPDDSYGSTTSQTTEARWAHLHRITGLDPGTTYHFRMVVDDNGHTIASSDRTLTTKPFADAIRVPEDVLGPPYVLDQAGATYLLTQDISAPGTAIEVTGTGAVVELDGHTVTFATESTEQVRGIFIHGSGKIVVGNHVDPTGSNISIHDNILTEGVHRGMVVSSSQGGDNIEIAYNDIRHHARYVNGYAIAAGGPQGVDIHHNRVTSMGRGVHITYPHTEFHDNYMDIKGHMTLDDTPAGSSNWEQRMIELHGIKLEEARVTDSKIYNNFVRIVQLMPDADWEYVPATPLNIACYDPNAMNEIFDNTFIALTWYQTPRHGGYGDSGQWAAAVYLVHMNQGPADAGNYAAYVHGNDFYTNDLFVGADLEPDMTIRIVNNTFTLVDDPTPMDETSRFRRIPSDEQTAIEIDNTFVTQ